MSERQAGKTRTDRKLANALAGYFPLSGLVRDEDQTGRVRSTKITSLMPTI